MDAWAGETTALYAQYVHETKSFFNVCSYLLADSITIPPDARVLDLAGGAGILSRMILEKEPSARITILDASADQLAHAKHVFKDKVEYALANAEKYEPDAPFDIVLCANAFWYLNEGIVHRVAQWLKPGGRFVFNLHERSTVFKDISFFNKVNAEVDKLSREEYRRACIMYTAHVDVEHLRGSLETAGFATTVEQVDYEEPREVWNNLMELQARRNAPYMAISIPPEDKLKLYKRAFKNVVKRDDKVERHTLVLICTKR